MARYRFANTDKTTVFDSTMLAYIPVDAGGWQGDAYRAWLTAGNTADPYIAVASPVQQVTPQSYPVATAPSASANANTIITITDLPEGSRNCYSDGANWRRVSDDTIVV